MKQILPGALLGLVLLHGGGGQVRSADKESAPAPPARKQPAVTGKVLLLENEAILEGEVERIGDQYLLRHTIGETKIPARDVLHLCSSIEDAYLFLRGRTNLDDPDERLKLARWCHQRALRVQALAEIKAAVALRPDHADSKRLLNHLQQLAAESQSASATPRRPEPEPAPVLHIELTGEALGHFTSRVQPILMNSCASCHATGRGGSFQLQRAYDSGNRRNTQYNLAAVLRQIDPQHPESSPFLAKALAVHGGISVAPFRNRETPAYRMLEDWVRLTVDNHPHVAEVLRQEEDLSLRASPRDQSNPSLARTPTQPPVANAPGSPKPPVAEAPGSPAPIANAPGSPVPDPNDPHDPEWFNQQKPGQAPPLVEPPK